MGLLAKLQEKGQKNAILLTIYAGFVTETSTSSL